MKDQRFAFRRDAGKSQNAALHGERLEQDMRIGFVVDRDIATDNAAVGDVQCGNMGGNIAREVGMRMRQFCAAGAQIGAKFIILDHRVVCLAGTRCPRNKCAVAVRP